MDIVMPMYNWIEYSYNYSKTSGNLRQYCKDIPAVNNNRNIVEFFTNVANRSSIFEITDTKLYVSVVTLSTQDNAKLLH